MPWLGFLEGETGFRSIAGAKAQKKHNKKNYRRVKETTLAAQQKVELLKAAGNHKTPAQWKARRLHDDDKHGDVQLLN